MSIPTARVLSISPAKARVLVKHRNHQRRTSLRTVRRFTKSMQDGRWRLTGATISVWIDTDGEWGIPNQWYVLNGMHRLLALIEADVTLQFLVVFEPTNDVFGTYDTGLTRTAGQIMGLAIGFENSQAISVMANAILHYERHPKELWLSTLVDKDEAADWAKLQHQARLHQCVRDYHALRAQLGFLGHWYSALDWLVHAYSPNASRWLEFHEALVHGNNLQSDDPRLMLRNQLMRSGRSGNNSRGGNDRWNRQMELAVGIKAWNLFSTGTTKQILVFRQNEVERSGMPKIQ